MPRRLSSRWARSLSILFAILYGCASIAAPDNSGEVAAVIVQPTTQSRESLQRIVSKSLARKSINLSTDALTQDSVLIIEPKRVRDPQGNLVDSREVRTLEHFHLVKKGSRCILIRETTGVRYSLAHTKCAPKV